MDIAISSYVDSCALTSQASSEAVHDDPKASAQEESLVYLLSPQSLGGESELLSVRLHCHVLMWFTNHKHLPNDYKYSSAILNLLQNT